MRIIKHPEALKRASSEMILFVVAAMKDDGVS